MFSRLVRVIKSWLGFFISYAEDPEVMLQESIEEMRNTLPKLNQILVTTRATEIRLEQDLLEAQRKEKSLVASIKTALADGSPEARRLAEDDASTLQQVRLEVQSTTEQLEAAKNAFENAKLSVDDIKEKLRARIEQSRKARSPSRRPRSKSPPAVSTPSASSSNASRASCRRSRSSPSSKSRWGSRSPTR